MRRVLIVGALLLLAARVNAAVPTSERDALIALYQSTNGDKWTDKTGWNGAPGTECSWHGVRCGEGEGHVVGLDLYDNHLDGALPASIRGLTKLEELRVSDNDLHAALPVQLAELAELHELDAERAHLAGAIPAQLGNLKKLELLGLDGNAFTGAIPAQLGDATALTDLGLEKNGLTGPIPPELGNLAALRTLDLAQNELTGELPASLYQLKALETLLLGENKLTGKLSPLIASLTKLEVLGLYDNQFTGAVPVELTTLAQLRQLGLQRNQFSGTLPVEIGRLTNLEALDVSGNDLDGPIPPQLGALSKLAVLLLYANGFDGTIPPELGNLANLQILSFAANHLTGTIPDALRNLTKLEQFYADNNQLTGALPTWIGEWTQLTDLFLSVNQLSGPLPAGLSTLVHLSYLDLADNQFTGPLMDFTRTPDIQYLTTDFNELSGPLPPSIGLLSKLDYATFAHNHFSGPLPHEIGGLASVAFLDLTENDFEGPIPPEIGQLQKAYSIALYGNHLSGPLPRELGNLTQLQYLAVSFNALVGALPPEIKNTTGLKDAAGLDLNYNGLYTNDASVREFVRLKSVDDFEQTQTVMPTDIRLVDTTDRSATLTWEPVRYNYYGGGYQVIASTTLGGPPAVVATTSSKALDTITVRNLNPSTSYFFTVATVSHPITGQENLIVSDRSAALQGATKPRVIAPADVVISDEPSGMVQIDGVEVESDSFTITNFGDVATSITLEKNDSFFTVTPTQFQLAGGASQIVTLHATPQPVGNYYGYVAVRGQGAPDDLLAYVVLLSTTKPSGTVIATPLSTRIELAGAPGSDQVGTVQFRNSGTARLTGIVVSDQQWVVVTPEPLTIEPGQVGAVNFQVVRSKRPEGTEGGLVANLTLLYVSGGESLTFKDIEALDGTSGVSISKVTIIDVTKPPVTSGSIPGLNAGELAFFIPGVSTSTTSHADISILNASGAAAINDLKLYFTNGAQTSIAALQPLGFAKGVSLPNVVGSIYGNANAGGTLQIRSGHTGSLATEAKVTAVTPGGTYTGSLPVFRGDRSIGAGARLYLTGLASPGDLLVQETSGGATNVHIELRDASGNIVASSDQPIAGYALLEVKNAIPPNVVTAVIRNSGPGLVAAYARLRDTNGDTWSVVDWSRFYQFALGDAVRIPFVDGAQTGGGKRRSVRGLAVAQHAATDVVLYNPGASEARATLAVTGASSRTVTVGAGATLMLANAGAPSSSPVASLVVTPTRGELVVTARTHHANGGSAIPVLPASAGLRLGQSQVFAGLDDSSTVRTSYGITAGSGPSVKVRVRIIIDETNPLTATITSKTFTLAANEQVFLPELVRSFAGDQRNTLFGDLHNLTLEFSVIEGNGAVVPFVIVTDVASGDSNVMVQ